MQQRPSKTELLRAVVQFLLTELYPAIPDKRLNFRVLIAANLASMVGSELESEDGQIEAETSRLEAILREVPGAEVPGTQISGARRLSLLNEQLVAHMRANRFDDRQMEQIRGHVKQTLIENLRIANPRFDTAREIEP